MENSNKPKVVKATLFVDKMSSPTPEMRDTEILVPIEAIAFYIKKTDGVYDIVLKQDYKNSLPFKGNLNASIKITDLAPI